MLWNSPSTMLLSTSRYTMMCQPIMDDVLSKDTYFFKVHNKLHPHCCHGSWLLQHLEPTDVVFFKDDQIMVLGFREDLPLGEGVLRMHFNGTLSDEMRGLHRGYMFLLAFSFLIFRILLE